MGLAIDKASERELLSHVRSIPDAAHVAKLLRPGAIRRHFYLWSQGPLKTGPGTKNEETWDILFVVYNKA